MPKKKTIRTTLKELFPDGTRGNNKRIDSVPLYPTDLFASAALLIERSGSYHKIKAGHIGQGKVESIEKFTSIFYDGNLLISSKAARLDGSDLSRLSSSLWREIGLAWKEDSRIILLLQKLWSALMKYRDEDIHSADVYPDWWDIAFALMAISDEACVGMGYLDEGSWFEHAFRFFESIDELQPELIDNDLYHHFPPKQLNTMGIYIDPDVACVLPKSRAASIGCTLRTLSHNLALLPAPYKANCIWRRAPSSLELNVAPLNILLVPFPYTLDASDFNCSPNEESMGPDALRWGEFSLTQRWIDTESKIEALKALILNLIGQCRDRGIGVDGIIFPEQALNWEAHSSLVRSLRQSEYRSVRFLISGTSDAPVGGVLKRGNFVSTSLFFEGVSSHTETESHSPRFAVTSIRGKHHRWRLDHTQVCSYGLDTVVDPHTMWWEDLSIDNRTIEAVVFRERSMFSTLICEDLARSEPVHSILQSVGPNIVFVLLLDGPQLPDRWAARCATGLAEDPGSSVITFTSRALLYRQSITKNGYSDNWNVALWKDDTQKVVTIDCPPEQKAVLLTLSAVRAQEVTLDSRANSDAWSWRLAGYRHLTDNVE